ncbi:hypothetical protein LCGC14_0312470 [marine sediment metagenome]|uniref:Uncharacterized protein n=1 Tax=marine sediment metagenome TaxID=412755 RepID=A0A0F9TLW1_9ZZZZ
MTNDKPQPQEKEAVRTTIVGGRPPGPGKSVGQIPQGIEVLVKKASVDPAFEVLLLEKRGGAAKEIDLQLDADEALLLAAIPREQLEAFIHRTRIPESSKAVFLGKVAAAMLIALGAVAGCDRDIATQGIREDDPKEKAAAASRPAESDARPAGDSPVFIAGIMIVDEPNTQPAPPAPQGIRPDTPATEPATQPGPPPGAIRSFSRGITPDHPLPPATQPAQDDKGPTSQPESQPASRPASQPADSADDAKPDDDSDRVDQITRGMRW